MTTVLEPSLRSTALEFASKLNRLKDEYVQRDQAITIIALAALCREHVLLIGPPGTAKTGLLERFSTMLNADHFSYLLTKFTEPAELFGSIDVGRFRRDSVYRINTDGMLPRKDIVFLDEIFNGSSAILNTLLTLINERVFYNGPQREDAPLITLLGSTNEMPDDSMLQAFCDRFLFRCQLGYVSDEAIDNVLDRGWANEKALLDPASAERPLGFDLHKLRTLQTAVTTIDLSGVRPTLVKILRSFRAEAIAFSDRRAVKAQKAIAAYALLHGRAQAELADLAVLTHLWNGVYDAASIHRVVETYDVPVATDGSVPPDINEITYTQRELEGALSGAESGEELREIRRQLSRLLAAVRRHHPEQAGVLRDIQALQRKVIEELRQRFGEDGGFDV